MKPKVRLKLLKGYEFKVIFPETRSGGFVMDEPPPLGNLAGPNASRALVASVANCLSASLLFCLQKSKVEVEDVETEAQPTVQRNDEGYWRVSQLDVSIRTKFRGQTDKAKVKMCLEIFEKYCVVTGAIRNGIPVNINVNTEGLQ